ncbi:NHLP bacteriocin export ABC transporter permease/ATPase subunit [Luxibacter massiliensis]|uniref:NHLP bacteriocin export ABC transporter permease/ATPase subunit n=1 Tax=Luxibacter massiliensis TaxID=2219695 RepID=UPI000F065CEC|nr:NHLP bacteriocin export ABC transporter permease/ATPase subunit [Luxibacter massiliensis]
MDKATLKKMIHLKGGDTYLTQNNTDTYVVTKGTVLVFVMPVFEDGENGRRLLLHEAQEGERIPSFYYERYGETHCFCLSALDTAQIRRESGTMTEDLGEEFVDRARLYNLGEENYVDLILEVYDRNSIKEEGYIFSAKKEQSETRRQGLRLIYNLFDKGSHRQVTPESGNRLYDAAAYVCDRKNISLSPYDKIVASAGRRFRLDDISRVSNFIIREVQLEHGWWKHDSDAMIGFLGKGHGAVALVPNGTRGYTIYNPERHDRRRVDEKIASLLEPKAYAVYAPFPNKKLTIKEMFAFSLKASEAYDWIRFCLLTLLGTFIGILLPMLTEQIYDNYIPVGSGNGLIQICAVLLACNLGNLAFTIVKNLSSLRGVSKMKNAVLAAACERLFNLPESFFRKYKSAELSDRVLQIDSMYNLISSVAIKTFISAAFSLLYLSQMHGYSPELMKFSLLMVLAVMIVVLILSFLQMKYEKQFLEDSAEANSRMYQYLSGIQKIRNAGVEDRALLEYLKPYSSAKKITLRKERITNVVDMLTVVAANAFSLFLYFQMVKNQQELGLILSTGQFTAFMAAFGSFSAAMMEVGTSLPQLNGIFPMLERIKPILQTLPEYTEDAELPGELTGNIEIANVSFAYDESSGMVLNDLSVHIRPGEYVGIVGASGCGKSTLMKLLLGFEKPVSGKIFYDSQDIERLDKRELRKKFGVVLQDGRLIGGSIFDNIVIAAPKATLKDAERVAAQVGLADDIARMPMGMHTVVSEMGGTISGGQQQRILIARAIAGKPKVLFFDEATSALDNVTQSMVCDSLNRLHVTRLVIAHRLSTVIDCDRILVMDRGRIVEEGDFDTLMEQKGVFYELASRQMA